MFVKLRLAAMADGEWTFDGVELRAAFHGQTKAIISNILIRPTGKVFM